MKIPVYSESNEFIGESDEAIVREAVAARRMTIVRNPKGTIREAHLIADVKAPLRGDSKREALDSYRGIDKYTYREPLQTAASIIMLKKYNPKTGQFVRWSNR